MLRKAEAFPDCQKDPFCSQGAHGQAAAQASNVQDLEAEMET